MPLTGYFLLQIDMFFFFKKGTAGGQQSSYVQSVGEAKGHVCVAVEVDRVNVCADFNLPLFYELTVIQIEAQAHEYSIGIK